MRRIAKLGSVLACVVLPTALCLTGCFTDVKDTLPEDARLDQIEAPGPIPDGSQQDVGPADAANDVPMPGNGGAGGSDGGGGPSFGGGGASGTGGLTTIPATGGTVSSGGVAGAGGTGTVPDAAVDQKQLLPVGAKCSAGADCALGNCIDGVCCATACAGCNACANVLTGKSDGSCAPVLDGQDPHDVCADETATKECGNDGMCDGAGACRKVSKSHVCKAAGCSSSQFTPASTCDGLGACTTPAPEECSPYQCTISGCARSCSSQTECGAGNYCKITSGTTGTCTAKNPNGTAATQPFECTSNVVADGVCCDKACTGCSACSGAPLTAGAIGQCSYVVAGQIAHSACTASGVTCGLDGKCDGAGACRYSPAEGASCDDPSNLCVTGKVCQNHACTAGTPKTCPPPTLQCRDPGTCVPATGSCNYPINDTLTCSDGNACTNDVCQGGTCVGTTILCNNPPACKLSTTCSAGQCNYTQNVADGNTDAKCPGGTPRCYAGTCVRCTADAHCDLPTPSCDPSTHTCVCLRPSSGNLLLKNPGFDGSLADWTYGLGSYSPIDADACSGSGSYYYPDTSDGNPEQCFPVTAGKNYYLGLRSRGGGPLTGGGGVRITMFASSGCGGSSVAVNADLNFFEPSDQTTWVSYYSTFTAPSGVVSARISIYAAGQWIDQVYVNPDGAWF